MSVKFAPELLPCGLTAEQAEVLFLTAVKRDRLREEVAALEAIYRQNLPFASDEQIAVLCRHTAEETELPVGNKPNVDFVLSDAQQARLSLVKADRAAWCASHKDDIMIPLQEDDEQRLVSFKVRAGAKKTTTTLRFERAHQTGPKAGLLAAIAQAAVSGR